MGLTPVDPAALPMRFAPGGTLRFAVAENDDGSGRRSSSYRIFTGKREPDIYVAVRQMAGTFKFSLHASGSNQYGFISDAAASRAGHEGPSRHIEIWNRPAPFADGRTHEFSIRLPHDEFSARPVGDEETGHIHALPAVGPGHACHIDIFRLERDPRGVTFDNAVAVALALFDLADGSYAQVIATRVVFTAEAREKTAVSRRQAIAQSKAAGIEIDRADNPRMGLYGNLDSGARFVREVSALESDSSGPI
jgi:hypothetical protein